jgi:adenine-specific DNA-methyltransferase
MKKEIYFNWQGKQLSINESKKQSLGKLSPCYEESVDWENTENVYIEGENLEVLKLLQDDYMSSIAAIYIEPPYNIGRNYVYKDDYIDNLSSYLINRFIPNSAEYNKKHSHANWLNMMYPRLLLAKKLLQDEGVIFISIDDYEACHLKMICNEIFGKDKSFFASLFCRKLECSYANYSCNR